MNPVAYEITFEGTISDEQLEELVGMVLVARNDRITVLRGLLEDQSALAGIVLRLEVLGCTVRDFFRADARLLLTAGTP